MVILRENRKIAAGIEFSFARQFFIRGGLSDGFGSFWFRGKERWVHDGLNNLCC